MFNHSVFQKVSFHNKDFIVMRDDLIHNTFSGNKARKLAFALDIKYSPIKKIVSFGGNQSNFMLALSQLAILKDCLFEYWTRSLPKFLKNAPNGNYKIALKNGMKIFETSENISKHILEKKYAKENVLIFDQGGREPLAEIGIKQMAKDILDFNQRNSIKKFSVFIASGTGTTAYYLQKHLPQNSVFTTPCVGNNLYLKEQMLTLENDISYIPNILGNTQNLQFGELSIDNLNIYKALKVQTNIEFDLLYDPSAWLTLLKNYKEIAKPIIYIHCGGTSGNETMIKRYARFLR